jgi:hypothetical protein
MQTSRPVVGSTHQTQVFERHCATLGKRHDVMDFQIAPRATPRSALTHEGALPTITSVDRAPQCTRDVATVGLALVALHERSLLVSGLIQSTVS